MALTSQFTSSLMMLCLLVTNGCVSVKVDRVELAGSNKYVTVQNSGPQTLSCWFSFSPGEAGEGVVWEKGGTQLQSTKPADPVDSSGLHRSTFIFSEAQRSDAGVYTCTVRTTTGIRDSAQLDLLVIDNPKSTLFTNYYRSNCVFYATVKTPAVYPQMSAFCGVWVPEVKGLWNDGYWMEPPPLHSASPITTSAKFSNNSKVLYSSERGDWNKTLSGRGLISFSLTSVSVKISDLPIGATWKCTYGFYIPDGEFDSTGGIMTGIIKSYTHRCPMEPLEKYSEHIFWKGPADHREDCLGYWISEHKIEETLHCAVTAVNLTLLCDEEQWKLKTDNGLIVQYDDQLQAFADQCKEDSKGIGIGSSGSVLPHATLVATAVLWLLRRYSNHCHTSLRGVPPYVFGVV